MKTPETENDNRPLDPATFRAIVARLDAAAERLAAEVRDLREERRR